MVRHWTHKPEIICSIRSSPTGGNSFFAVNKSFEYKIAISANFVQTVKNSYVIWAMFHITGNFDVSTDKKYGSRTSRIFKLDDLHIFPQKC